MGSLASSMQNSGPTANSTTQPSLYAAQPIIIEGSQWSSGFLAGTHCDVMPSVDMWRACRAEGVPMELVDVPYAQGTTVLFGSNNMLALIYNTMFITAMLSLATLPVPGIGSLHKLWPFLACMGLLGNLIAMLVIPYRQQHMHLPTNNMAVVAVLHIVSILGVVLLCARDSDFTKKMTSDGTMVCVRYFEYSMTAGLFLIATMSAVGSSGEAYTYQVAYQGMLVCNLLGIPITLGVLGCASVLDSFQDMELIGSYMGWAIGCIVAATAGSTAFFVASMIPILSAVGTSVFGIAGVPGIVKGMIGTVLGLYFAFAFVGVVTISVMVASLIERRKR